MRKEILFVIVFSLGLILLIVFELDWFNKNSGALVFTFTGIYAALTYLIVRSNLKILEETTRPYVLVTLPVKAPFLILLSIKNLGKRPAVMSTWKLSLPCTLSGKVLMMKNGASL